MMGSKITIIAEDGVRRDFLVVGLDRNAPDDPSITMTIEPVEPGTVSLPDPAPLFLEPEHG